MVVLCSHACSPLARGDSNPILVVPRLSCSVCSRHCDSLSTFPLSTGIVRGLQRVCEHALKYKLVDACYLISKVKHVAKEGDKPLEYYGIVTAALHTKV